MGKEDQYEKIKDIGMSHRGLVNYISEMIPKNRNIKILDVGGGIGNLEVILEKRNYRNITILDKDKRGLNIAKKRLKYTKFVIHDLMKGIPFNKNSFDLVLCIEVLQHVDNPYLIIKECLRVGKEFILSVPNGFWQEITPENYIKNGPNFFAPTWRYLERGIELIGGKILSVDHFYCRTGFIRKLIPRLFCTSFIIRMRKRKN